MKARIVHTKIWSDPWYKRLSRAGKIVFIYLITNQSIGLTGIYEIGDETICFDTGVTQQELEKVKQELSEKVRFHTSWVKIINADRYQTFSGPKNEKAKEKELNFIPPEVIDTLSIPYRYPIDSTSNQYSVISNKKSVISKRDSVTEKDMSEIAEKYQVPLSFVISKFEDVCNWEDEKPGRMSGRNWKLTLINWVKRDAIKIKGGTNARKSIDARNVK